MATMWASRTRTMESVSLMVLEASGSGEGTGALEIDLFGRSSTTVTRRMDVENDIALSSIWGVTSRRCRRKRVTG